MSHFKSLENITKRRARSTEEDNRATQVALHKRKNTGYVVGSRKPRTWNSGTSTSSLAQLHEKLALLPRFTFEKESVQVCATPELSTVTELSEIDESLDKKSKFNLTSSTKITQPSGVFHKNSINKKGFQNEIDAHCRPSAGRLPIARDDENSIFLLDATVGSNESVINDTIERLNKHKDFQGDNIVDLLLKEPWQQDTQTKDKIFDSGINTGDCNKTQEQLGDNNVKQNKNYQNSTKLANKTARGNFCTIISNTTTDESNDVIYESQLNFVNNRKRLKAVEEVEEERPEYDVNVQEEFFSQHITRRESGEIVISPTLGRKINETSSESDDYLNDGILQMESNEIKNKCNSAIETENDIEVIQCLESVLKDVCSNVEKCVELLNNEIVFHDCHESQNTVFKGTTNIAVIVETTKNKQQDSCLKQSIKSKRRSKRIHKTKSKYNKNKLVTGLDPCDMATNNEVNGVTKNVISKKLSSPEFKDGKSDCSDTPLARRKRKLYSSTNGNENISNLKSEKQEHISQNNNFQNTKTQTQNCKATSYKDIEKDRKRFRQPRARKPRNKVEQPLSPRTMKINDVFDQLKEEESKQNVILIDKDAVYNFTSDSDDEDFKKNVFDVRKRVSSNSRRNRQVTANSRSSTEKNEPKKVKQLKARRIPRRKQQTKKEVFDNRSNLVDEKMRGEVHHDLNTSLENIKPVNSPDTDAVMEPRIPLVIEIMPDYAINNTNKSVVLEKTKKNKISKALGNTKVNAADTKINDNTSVSPLPELVFETIPQNTSNENDSILLQKFHKIFQDPSNACMNQNNTTQNLTDIEIQYNSSPPHILGDVNTTQNKVNKNNTKLTKNKYSKKYNLPIITNTDNRLDMHKNGQDDIIPEVLNDVPTKIRNQNTIDITEMSEDRSANNFDSDKSITTVGKYPITAHNDSDETPPDSKLLTENIKPRDLEIEYLDEPTKTYYKQLTNVIQDQSITTHNIYKECERLASKSKRDSSEEKYLIVSIPKISLDDISKWLPSRRNSYTDSSVSKQTSVKNSSSSKKDKGFDFDRKSNNILCEVKSDSSRLGTPYASIENSISPRPILRRKKTRPSRKHDSDESDTEKSLKSIKVNDALNTGKQKSNRRDIEEKPPTCTKRLRSRKEMKCKYVESVSTPGNETSKKCIPPYNKKQSYMQIKKAPVTFAQIKYESAESCNEADSIDRQVMTSKKWLRSHNEESRRIDEHSAHTELKGSTGTGKTDVSNKQIRKSVISPIKMFHEIFPSMKKNTSKKETIMEIETNNNNNLTKNSNTERKTIELLTGSSSNSKASKLSQIVDSKVVKLKRKSTSLEISPPKLMKWEETMAQISDSGTSISTVNEWFRRNKSYRDKGENINVSYIETIQNIMEKLDTSITEIHQHTSKRFIHMFVNAQSQLASEMEQRRQQTDALSKEILAKFSEVEQRTRQFDEEFMKQLKMQAVELIREESKKKKLVVRLLKEDIQAVLNHANKEGGLQE